MSFFYVRKKLTKTALQFLANVIFNDEIVLIKPYYIAETMQDYTACSSNLEDEIKGPVSVSLIIP